MKTFLNVPSKVKPSLLKERKSTGCCELLIISLIHFLLEDTKSLLENLCSLRNVLRLRVGLPKEFKHVLES